MAVRIQHSSHKHPLSLGNISEGEFCWACGLACEDIGYYCEDCPFFIHKTCLELPREINHPFHPQHPLTLLAEPPYTSGEFTCSACGNSALGSTYHCPECQFDLEVNCAALMPTKRTTNSKDDEHNNKSYHYIGEPHPLILCCTKKDIDFYCCGCNLIIEKDSIYVCLECKILLDESCAKLPKEIEKHPFHPHHTLTLLSRPPYDSRSFRCSACGGSHGGLTFHCSVECEFDLDVNCAFLMPINTDDDDYQQYVSHPHPLILCRSSKNKFPFSCYACHYPFSDDSSIYCCLHCKMLLHQSCAKLPSEIEHTYHPLHSLKLINSPRYFVCKACMRRDQGFAYNCYDCDFRMHIGCSLSTPLRICSQLHNHPLAFFDFVASGSPCSVCHDFSWKFDIFRCVECNFNVHLICIPTLPPTARDGHHRHPLTLTKSPIKDHEDEDEYSEFLCDSCEKERRLCEPTYYCAECHYVAHVHCLISEIVRLMEEEWSLAHKVGDTKVTSSIDVGEENTNEVVSIVLIEEVEGTTNTDVDVNGDKARNTSTQMNHSLGNDELDEQIVVLHAEIKEQEAKLEALRKKLEPLEKQQLARHIRKWDFPSPFRSN